MFSNNTGRGPVFVFHSSYYMTKAWSLLWQVVRFVDFTRSYLTATVMIMIIEVRLYMECGLERVRANNQNGNTADMESKELHARTVKISGLYLLVSWWRRDSAIRSLTTKTITTSTWNVQEKHCHLLLAWLALKNKICRKIGEQHGNISLYRAVVLIKMTYLFI